METAETFSLRRVFTGTGPKNAKLGKNEIAPRRCTLWSSGPPPPNDGNGVMPHGAIARHLGEEGRGGLSAEQRTLSQCQATRTVFLRRLVDDLKVRR